MKMQRMRKMTWERLRAYHAVDSWDTDVHSQFRPHLPMLPALQFVRPEVDWLNITNEQALAAMALTPSGAVRPLLTTNTKTRKSTGVGMSTMLLHLSPSTESGFNTCGHATGVKRGVITAGVGCAGNCLVNAGQMILDTSKVSRILKTALYVHFERMFLWLLDDQLTRHSRSVARLNMREARHGTSYITGVRLNGTSDIQWVRDHRWLIEKHADIVFYDYTKYPYRLSSAQCVDANNIRNYHTTYSLPSTRPTHMRRAQDWMKRGYNVAIVLRTRAQVEELLARGEFMGRFVIDGDESDARPLDKHERIGGWVLLYAKGHEACGINREDDFFLDLHRAVLPTWEDWSLPVFPAAHEREVRHELQ